MIRSSNKKPAFYVVQFIEMPFESIDDYVCVPNSWLVVHRACDHRASVAYPKDEDPFDTRDRAERKETYNDEWRCYMAAVKYESDNYREAEYWIATRNDYGPLVQEESEISDTQLRFRFNKKFRSATQIQLSKSNDNPRKPLPRIAIKRPALPEPKKQLDGKRSKLDKDAHSSSVVNDANAGQGCSNWEQSINIKNIQSIAVASHGGTSLGTDENLQESLPIQMHQGLNMPLLDDIPVDEQFQPTINMEQQRFSFKVLSQFAEQSVPVQEPQISVPMEMLRNNQELRPDNVFQNNTMPRFSRNNRREFYVVQFQELPYEYIQDYVIVPSTWLIVLRASDQKAVVAYPKHEPPFHTRARARRKEKYDDKWRFYMAVVKYGSDSYSDAEYWIGSRNDYRPLVQEEAKLTQPQPRLTLKDKLRSAIQSHLSKSNDNHQKLRLRVSIKPSAQSKVKKRLDALRLKRNKAAQLSSGAANDANEGPRCSKKEQSINIDQSLSLKSNDNPRKLVMKISIKRPSLSKTKNLLDGKRVKPAQLCSDSDANEETEFSDDDQSTIIEHRPVMECAQTEETSVCVGNSSSSQHKDDNLQQSLTMPLALRTCHDQELCTGVVVNNESTSHHLLDSLKMADNLYSHINGARRLVPIQKPVEKRIRPILPLPRRTQRI